MESNRKHTDKDNRLVKKLGWLLEEGYSITRLSDSESGKDELADLLQEYKFRQTSTDLLDDNESEELWSGIKASMDRTAETTRSARGQVRRLQHSSWWAMAAILLLAFGIGIYLILNIQDDTLIAETATETRIVTLDDGSQVTMRPHSQLTSRQDDGVYELSGEAFFEIADSPDRTFTVEGAGARINVTGTSFSFSTWRDLPQVFLQSGRIIFEDIKSQASNELMPGQLGRLTHEGDIHVGQEPHYQEEYLDWLHGIMVFESRSLDRILRELEYHFNIRIETHAIDTQQPISGRIYLEEAEEALTDLATILDAVLEKSAENRFQIHAE